MPKFMIKHKVHEAKMVDGVTHNTNFGFLPATQPNVVLARFQEILSLEPGQTQIDLLKELLDPQDKNNSYIPNRSFKEGTTSKKLHHISYVYYQARPMLEGLFYEHTAIFHAMVNALRTAGNEAVFNMFLLVLSNTELKSKDLFAWDTGIYNKVRRELLHSKEYCLSLYEKKIERGDVADKVVIGPLWGFVEKWGEKVPMDNTWQSKLDRLSFKLDILKHLHSKDKDFKDQRQYVKMFANVMSALFAFVPNVLNYVVTGNWFFGNKTRTMENIDRVHKATGIKHSVRF